MNMSDTEELNARCNFCAAGLLYLEHYLFGNRCVFCAEKKHNISKWLFLKIAWHEWLIYQELHRLSRIPEGRLKLVAALGNLGKQDINMCKTVKDKKELLAKLRRAGR